MSPNLADATVGVLQAGIITDANMSGESVMKWDVYIVSE